MLTITLAEGLAKMAGEVPINQVETVIDKLADAIRDNNDLDQTNALRSDLAALGSKAPQEQMDAFVIKFIDSIKKEEIDFVNYNLADSFAQSLMSAAKKLTGIQRPGVAAKLLKAILGSKNPAHIGIFSQGMGVLKADVTESQSTLVAEKIVDTLRYANMDDFWAVQTLSQGLAHCLPRLRMHRERY